MAVFIHLDLDYVEEFSLKDTQRYINVEGQWVQVDPEDEVVLVFERGEEYA